MPAPRGAGTLTWSDATREDGITVRKAPFLAFACGDGAAVGSHPDRHLIQRPFRSARYARSESASCHFHRNTNMTIFDDLLAIADGAITATAAEAFVLHPQVRTPNGHPMPDPDREVVRARGVFELRAGQAGGVQLGNRSFNRKRNDLRLISTAPAPRISIAERELGATRVHQGDRVDLIDRSPPQRFEVVSVQPDGHGRVVVELVER